jgi:hypothetical protein
MKENYGERLWKRSIVKKETFFVLTKIMPPLSVKMGYMWSVGKGDKVRFWEDT